MTPDSGVRDPAQVLLEAIPYITRYVGRTIVLKIGGSVGEASTVLEDVVWLRRLGILPVIVHGGGPLISHWLQRIGKETSFVDGLRYTDEETLDVVRMVLIGKVNSDLVAQLHALGGQAIGISGIDGGLLRAVRRDERLGLVGDVVGVDLRPLEAVMGLGYIPVVAPLALGEGGQALNVNADTAAGELALAMKAEKLVFFTDVPGVLDEHGQLLARVTVSEVNDLLASGTIRGGMIPKVQACIRALGAVPRAHIIDGRVPHALIRELFTDRGVGTMLVAGR